MKSAVVFAYNNIGCVGIEALVRAGWKVPAVFTHVDDPNENTYFRSVATVAAGLGIPVYSPDDPNAADVVARVRELAPDALFSFYYRKMLSQELLDILPLGGFNLHGSKLPAYRGRCPVNWVLVNGERETGVTLHRMTAKPDNGDIVAQRTVPITDDDTAFDLHAKCVEAAKTLLDETLPDFAAKVAAAKPQDASCASYYGGRRPADGRIDWTKSAKEVRNLVRAVTHPYPGAFTYFGSRKILVWSATVVADCHAAPGEVATVDPLVVGCGRDALRIELAQGEPGTVVAGAQLAAEEGVSAGSRLGDLVAAAGPARFRVLVLGAGGFIGSHLCERLLADDDAEVYGTDLRSENVAGIEGNPRFHFRKDDLDDCREWVEECVRCCDAVVPLAAIATPIEYTRNPLRVFELDFEQNLRVVRLCHKYGKRIVFPSTSEVYGMCDDSEFDEESSRLVLGPIASQRWIYSCIKQMLDRVIWAYGTKGLKFTLFRPFNWIGPRLDTLEGAKQGRARVITQFILNLVRGDPLLLVDGGEQRRCFTDVHDGVECLYRIVRDRDGRCDGKVINIGNPDGEASIRKLAETLVACFERHPLRDRFPAFAGIRSVGNATYYGRGYQDCQHRKPSIGNAEKYCDWRPSTPFVRSVESTLDFFLRQASAERAGL